MTDINKQIEEEAREYAFKSCPYHYSDCKIEHCNSNCQWHRYSQQDDSYKKFKQGAQFVLNSSRWRKVSEKLPEDSGWYLVRFENKNYIPEVVRFNSELGWVRMFAESIAEWKQID